MLKILWKYYLSLINWTWKSPDDMLFDFDWMHFCALKTILVCVGVHNRKLTLLMTLMQMILFLEQWQRQKRIMLGKKQEVYCTAAMAFYGSEAIPPLKGDAAMVTISLKSSIIISSWVQLALSHCPLNFLQIRFEMKTSLWKFIIATALGKITFWSILKYLWCMRIWITIWQCDAWVVAVLPPWPSISECSLSLSPMTTAVMMCHDRRRQPSTCISLSSPLL